MTTTREQVADLHEGDVVELRWSSHPDVFLRGPLHDNGNGSLYVGWLCVQYPNGQPAYGDSTLTLVSRAVRSLYVNHPRTKPNLGDVVRDADDEANVVVWLYTSADFTAPWYAGAGYFERKHMPARLRLLVDGETGMPVGLDFAEAWDEGFEAGANHAASNGRVGIPHDPPTNPYETDQVVQ